ncbi:MAG: biotin--[Ruminococcus sp.]|nr:biotin--[acetyl-CoA-carboxylase] ligase [Ruminococcus sp.]
MNVKETVLKQLAASEGEYISGAALARNMNISRNAVWKVVKSLEKEGFSIEAVTSKGYRISEDNNKLSEDIIKAVEKSDRDIIVLDEVDSTNDYAKKLAARGAKNGTAVIADRQTAGKGRMGRNFVSPPGCGVYISIIIRPKFGIETSPLITSAAACAAANAIEMLCKENVGIKWVNDLYMNDKKICGILTEASMGLEMRSLDYAVIGIGINVGKNDEFDSELRRRASSIEECTGKKIDRNRLCAEILRLIDIYLENPESREYLEEYRKREILTGHEITAQTGGTSIRGIAEGIDDNANLIVRLADGSKIHLGSGEATLCRPVNNS